MFAGVTWGRRAFSARTRVKVVLVKDFPQLGYAGEVKEVRAGYARNHLVPQRIAMYGTPENLQKHAIDPNDARLESVRVQRQRDAARRRLSQIVLSFKRRANENSELYGSVTAKDIGDLLFAKYNIDIPTSNIKTEIIRTLGDHNVEIRVENNDPAYVKVVVKGHGKGEIQIA
ncbi:50S ribosomal protein L9, chloroplastic [Plasmodiophora brassicae]|uniref:50S ribosomal protein L9, chloroplastic n=1 Tax=Plasmodiophora brassicae TaxID=37360 RepID=A0A0G4IRE7_PLABS|nr:hypothetical protein PBRA_005881 [Plasmodiophora brassicae]SPQ98314.1 unnamed protein product [Plasmodiophora brassicae]